MAGIARCSAAAKVPTTAHVSALGDPLQTHVSFLTKAARQHDLRPVPPAARPRQRIQRGADGGKTVRHDRLFEEQDRAALQAGLALLPGRLTGQHHHLLARVGVAEQLEKLDPIHHRHADVQHYHVHPKLGQQDQRLRVIFRRENVPPPACPLREQPLDAGMEPSNIVHKQEGLPFDDFA